MVDRATLRTKIFWRWQRSWHLRYRPTAPELSLQETVAGLQTLLLARQGTILAETLHQTFARPVALDELDRLEIALYQEGVDQRVWRAQATLCSGLSRPFGLIVARAPGASSALTRRDFAHLQALFRLQPQYCVQPYVCGTIPLADGVAAYTVAWLDEHKELVFEVTLDGGVFLINAHGAHRRFSPQESRRIWRRIVEILWWYPRLRRVNVQAGDFVGRVLPDGEVEVKLTTARELVAEPSAAEQIHAILRCVITASGYLSDGQCPFDRHMPEEVFLRRMQAVLQRRFGARAPQLARRQWQLFRQGAFARQEDWLKEDCILATYDRMRAVLPAAVAWRQTCEHWQAYAAAVQAGRLPPSWWFPAAEIPMVLARVGRQYPALRDQASIR